MLPFYGSHIRRQQGGGGGGAGAASNWEKVASIVHNDAVRNHNYNFPVGTQAGDLVLAISNLTDDISPGLPNGWELLVSTEYATTNNCWFRIECLNKVTTQTYYTPSYTSGVYSQLVLVTYRPSFDRSGWAFSAVDNKGVTTGNTGRPDSPSVLPQLSQPTAISVAAVKASSSTLTAPSGYSDFMSGEWTRNTITRGYAISKQDQPADLAVDPPVYGDPSVTDYQWAAATILLRTTELDLPSFNPNNVTTYNLSGTVSAPSFTVSGEGGPWTISISGGNSSQYSINGGSFTSSDGTVSIGDSVVVRQTVTDPGVGGTASTTATITIGSVSRTSTLTTNRFYVYTGYYSDRSTTITLPTGITSVNVNMVGCGGEGGGYYYINGDTNVRSYNGAGGGGAFVQTTNYPVSSGQVLYLLTGSTTFGSGTWTSDTYVSLNNSSGTKIALAKGGQNGYWATSFVTGGAGGQGGQASGCIGTIKYSGGNGGTGYPSIGTYSSPGGGSAGGYSANGVNGANGSTGAIAGTNGQGGSGASGSNGGYGGGGTGISGAGANGVAPSGEGSPDSYAGAGGVHGGGAGGGGYAGTSTAISSGGIPLIKVWW